MSLRHRLATFVVAATVLAAPAAFAAEYKAAYVDLQRALLEVDEGRAAKARLKKMLEDNQREIDQEQGVLRQEKALLDKQASAMSEETRLRKETELQQKIFALAQKWEANQKEMVLKERTELQTIFAKMDPIIAEIAQNEGFTMVFEKTDSGLIYAPGQLDLTNQLVREYNKRHGKKSSAKKTAPAPAAAAGKK